MKIEFNTLAWTNAPVEMIDAHKRVTDHFNIPVNYYRENVRHGAWMDRICRQSESDIIGFFDSDCVPINYESIIECARYIKKTKSFLGIAQVSNHIDPKVHIYAAPAFYLIHKECWEKLNTSFLETSRSDVAEELSYVAVHKGIKYRCLYPDTFEDEPEEGVWPLGNYGYYGIGTTFNRTVYHLYQGRFQKNLKLFLQRCDDIISDTFDNRFHKSSTMFNYDGRVVA